MARHGKDEMNAERLDNPDLNDNNTVTQMHKKHNKKKKKTQLVCKLTRMQVQKKCRVDKNTHAVSAALTYPHVTTGFNEDM